MIKTNKKPWKRIVRLIIRRSGQFLAACCPVKTWRGAIRDAFDRRVVRMFRPEIDTFIERYPSVMSEEDTLQALVEKRLSIARFGDGEFKLMVGEVHKSFQDVNPELNARMAQVLASNDPRLIVAIHPVREFETLGQVWHKFIIRIGDQVLKLLDLNRRYGSMGVFRRLDVEDSESFLERVRAVKQLWAERDIVLVVGKESRFVFEEELFNNSRSVSYVYGPRRNAFAEIDSLMNTVRTYDQKDHLILLVLGPTATVMAHELALEGYQAIDFGQMPGQFRKMRRRFFKDEESCGL